MPNQPATPNRNVRVPDDMWDAVERIAADRQVTASEIVRRALDRYIRTEWPGHDIGPPGGSLP